MAKLRKRNVRTEWTHLKTHPESPGDNGSSNGSASEQEEDTQTKEETSHILSNFLCFINVSFGVTLMIVIGYKYATYIKELHEKDMWFSEITEVEREISFRTESGLYYSYYKQLVSAPSIAQGLYDLTHDNITEHLRTINILARFNIYQEVVLGILYRVLPIQNLFEPVYFYIDTVFALNGMLVCALYLTAWLLSGTWLSGLLAACFYIFNKYDMTRVGLYIPLREHFSLPFLWIHILAVSQYFKRVTSQTLCLVVLSFSTLCFSITWQFNQFVLLLQAMALFGVWVLDIIPGYKVRRVYAIFYGSLFIVAILQFFNTMIIGSLVISFMTGVFLLMYIRGDSPSQGGLILRVMKLVFYIIASLSLMIGINNIIKLAIQIEADEHIYKFVLNKFGMGFSRDFDVRMYLCNGAFQFLPPDTLTRLSEGLVFPLYVVVEFGLLVVLMIAVIQNWSNKPNQDAKKNDDFDKADSSVSSHALSDRPELGYHAVQSVFFGAMAISTLRMKYLWTPHMCILAAYGIADYDFWLKVLSTMRIPQAKTMANILRNVAVIAVLATLLYKHLPIALKELEDLREFYDPDTVDLMNWINEYTPKTAAFTGSMQLLAGVKLCTGRPLTNHPHYEDKVLRHRTKELYQYYGRRSPEDVFKIMKKYDVSYIILEDSICLAPSRDYCRTPDLIDLDSGVLPDGGRPEPGLVQSNIPRFCDEIRYGRGLYKKYFKLEFSNRTFRVYKVLK